MTLSLNLRPNRGLDRDKEFTGSSLAFGPSFQKHQDPNLGDRISRRVYDFFYGMTDTSMMVGMAVGFTAFNAARTLIQPALMRSSLPLFSQIPLVTRATSAALATIPEIGAMWGSSKLAQHIAQPGSVRWDRASAAQEMMHFGMTFCFLKSFGFAFKGMGPWGHQAGMLTGIMASNGAEILMKRRRFSGLADFMTDSLITLGQFNAGGIISQKLLPGLYRFNETLQQKLAHQERAQWGQWREEIGDLFTATRNWAPVHGEALPRVLQTLNKPFLIKAEKSPDTQRSGVVTHEGEVSKSPRKNYPYFAERIVLKGESSLSIKLFSKNPIKDAAELAWQKGESFLGLLDLAKGENLLRGGIANRLKKDHLVRAFLLSEPVKRMELQIDVDRNEILNLRIFKDDLRFDVSPTKVSLIEEISFLSEENSTGKVETKIKNFKLHPILSAEAYILLDLSEIPGHPRALKERISKKSQGTINPGEATFYAAKKRLEQKKLIRMVRLEKQEHAGRPRQWYELTDTGRGQVRQIKLILSQFLKNFPKMGG